MKLKAELTVNWTRGTWTELTAFFNSLSIYSKEFYEVLDDYAFNEGYINFDNVNDLLKYMQNIRDLDDWSWEYYET